MIVEWLGDDGNTVRFDSSFGKIFVVTSSGEVVSPVRDATPAEWAKYEQLFESLTDAQRQQRAAVLDLLGGTLQALRSATADSVITTEEFISMSPQVQSALMAYSAYGRADKELDRLAFLVLTQVVFSFSFLLQGSAQRFADIQSYVFTLTQRIQALET